MGKAAQGWPHHCPSHAWGREPPSPEVARAHGGGVGSRRGGRAPRQNSKEAAQAGLEVLLGRQLGPEVKGLQCQARDFI